MTAPSPFGLNWRLDRPSAKTEHAMLGEVCIGSIGERTHEPGAWWYMVDAIDVKWLAKRNGEVKSKASARAAIERAWEAWLKTAGLIGADAATANKNPAHAAAA